MRGVSLALALGLLLGGALADAAAQQPAAPAGTCQLVFAARDTASPPHVTQLKQPSGQFNSFIGGGVIARCPAQGMTLIADSAEYYGDTRVLHLIGHVHYTEPRLTLDSDLADYFLADERLVAQGHVHTVLPSGTTLDGPRVDYLRAVRGVRTLAVMTAPGRPTIKAVERDSTGKPAPPVLLVANTVIMHGDSLMYAAGKVQITRPDVVATGDSAVLDNETQYARLLRGPRIQARGDRPFTLTGTVIDLFGQERSLRRVLAKGKARGVSRDATLTADTLDFAMTDGRLQRVQAWGASRARAMNPAYDIVADSLDVRMPDQRMREIHALRDAFAQSVPDTTRIRTAEHDWLRGDTVYAYFDSAAAAGGGSSAQPSLRELMAIGHARSFYQIAPRDTAAIGPAVNYVRGDTITVAFANRAARRVTISGDASGVYLDPAPVHPADSTARGRADSTAGARPAARPAVPPHPAAPGRGVARRTP